MGSAMVHQVPSRHISIANAGPAEVAVSPVDLLSAGPGDVDGGTDFAVQKDLVGKLGALGLAASHGVV